MRLLILIWLLHVIGCGASLRDNESKPLRGYWYTVKTGDSMASLKDAHGVNLDDLREINGLGEAHVLKPGQRLFLFGVAKPRPRSSAKKKTPRKAAKRVAREQLPRSNRKWIWPVRGARLTSKFGKRGNRPHKGIDLQINQDAYLRICGWRRCVQRKSAERLRKSRHN